MTVRNLEFLFRPKSVAVVAEPGEPSRYAGVVLRNLAAGGFAGPVMSVAAKRRSRFVPGSPVHIDELATAPDLAIVCAALRDVAPIIAQLGARGTRAVIIGPALRDKLTGSQVMEARKAILDAARPYLMRVLGPGSGGLIVPAAGLNASVAPSSAIPGKIALITRSTAVATAALERAWSKKIGFSTAIHIGASIDVDLADVLDWLAEDPDTESILVHFDSVPAGRKFMSAARAAARNKPVIAIRGGWIASRAPASTPFSSDDVYEAALRRAGWVSIDTLRDWFGAAEALARVRGPRGERLMILANGHGLGRIAADTLRRSGGELATMGADTIKRLNKLLPVQLTKSNPLALPADVTPDIWAATLAAILADRDTDAVMTVCSPSPFAPGPEVAEAICTLAGKTGSNLFTCWVGGAAMLEAQQVCATHGVLSQDSPEAAIAIFQGIVNYRRNRELLMQMPPSLAEDFSPDSAAARDAIAEALAAGAEILPERQARHLLRSYGIDVAEHALAGGIDAAIRSAEKIGYPVDIALVLSNLADFGLMASGLRSPADIRLAVRGLRNRARSEHPTFRVNGYRLRPSATRSGAPALHLGIADDPVFGPVIFLGPAAEGPRAGRIVVALPPLNLALARDLVARSRFSDAVAGDQRESLELAASQGLVRLSQLLTDIDEVAGVELDPLHVEAAGMVVLDCRIRIEHRRRKVGLRRLAIRPYPKELEQVVDWNGLKLLIRPIRPEDENTLGDLLNSLAPEDSRMRFFDTMRKLPRSQLARFTQIDYDREMALVAIERTTDGVERSLGEVRLVADPDNVAADFAMVVSSRFKGKGLGHLLLQRMIDYARERGIGELRGETLAANVRMQRLAQRLGFSVQAAADPGTVALHLVLHRRVEE